MPHESTAREFVAIHMITTLITIIRIITIITMIRATVILLLQYLFGIFCTVVGKVVIQPRTGGDTRSHGNVAGVSRFDGELPPLSTQLNHSRDKDGTENRSGQENQ